MSELEPTSNSEISDMTPKELNNWCMFLHFGSITAFIIPILGVIVPLILWQVKNEHPRVDMHGKEVMNYSITMFIYFAFAYLLSIVLIGLPLLALLWAYSIAIPIIAGLKANSGKFYKYPFIFRIL